MQHHSDPPEPFPHNEEPQLRKLGLHTTMKRGVPTLENPQTVCEEGKKITSEQARLLKLMGIKMVEFKLVLRARWSAADSQVAEIEGDALPIAEDGAEDDAEMDE
jgi:mRNA turnover protein 4